jgi:hypothetical protein
MLKNFFTFRFPVHDNFAPEITAELGAYVFDKITTTGGIKSVVNQAGKDFIDALQASDPSKIDAFLNQIKPQIQKYTEEYVKNHPKEFKIMEARLEKAEKRKREKESKENPYD